MAESREFNGVPAFHERPGGFTITRRLASATYTNESIDFRSPDWFGACEDATAAEQSAAITRGELKRVIIRLVTGTSIAVGKRVGSYAAGRYGSADANNRIVQVDYSNRDDAHRQWWTSSGAVVLEVDAVFDIPPAGQE